MVQVSMLEVSQQKSEYRIRYWCNPFNYLTQEKHFYMEVPLQVGNIILLKH